MSFSLLVTLASLNCLSIFAGASSSEDDGIGRNYRSHSCDGAETCSSKEHLLLQMYRDFAVKTSPAKTSLNAAWCCSLCGRKGFCSPQSGNCYDDKRKYYYESCEPVSVSCCAACDGESFCSPQSGQCYTAKRKDYYTECAPMGTLIPNETQEQSACCAACDGESFCSPQSGQCYTTKRKDYYIECAPMPSLIPNETHEQSACCAACDGESFCSPRSGQCYTTKRKDYYTECAPMPTLIPNETQEPACCTGCLRGEAGFCSPNSGNCYPSQFKSYYQSCPNGGSIEPKKHELIVDWVKFFPFVNGSLTGSPTWEDNFDNCPDDKPDPNKWKYEIFGPNSKNSEAQTYTNEKENAFCEDGQLILRALCKDGKKCRGVTCSPGGDCSSPHGALTSGSIETGFNFGFGRLTARIKIGGEQEGRIGTGMWPAFWSLGEDIWTNGWPSCGEIDIMEYSQPHKTNGQNAYFRNNPYTWKRQHWVTTETKVHHYAMDSDGYRVFTLEYAQDVEGHTHLKMWVTETYEETLDAETTVNIEYPKPGMPRDMIRDFDHSFNGKKINAKLNVAVGGNLGGRGPYFD